MPQETKPSLLDDEEEGLEALAEAFEEIVQGIRDRDYGDSVSELDWISLKDAIEELIP